MNVNDVQYALFLPEFVSKPREVFDNFTQTTDLDLQMSYAGHLYRTLHPIKVTNLINTLVLMKGSDDLIKSYVKDNIEIYRECFCFYTLY